MNYIPKNIDREIKFVLFLTTKDFVIFLLSLATLYFTSSFLIGVFKLPYIIIGSLLSLYLLLPSPHNFHKNNYQAIYYFLKRNNSTVKSIDKITFNSKIKVKKSMLDFIDITKLDKEKKHFIHKDEKVSDIFKISSLDLFSISEDEKSNLIYQNTLFYNTYKKDIKLIFMNYPCSYKQQISFLEKKLEKSSEVKQKFLKLKIAELKKLEDTIYDKEYYIVVYSNNLSELEEDKRLLLSSFPLSLETISEEKKEKIFFKLNNLNSAL